MVGFVEWLDEVHPQFIRARGPSYLMFGGYHPWRWILRDE